MRNVSLKVLEKSLKFLFKKGYEPCWLIVNNKTFYGFPPPPLPSPLHQATP